MPFPEALRPAYRELIDVIINARLEDQAIAERIPVLVPISNPVSLLVRQQYEERMYVLWLFRSDEVRVDVEWIRRTGRM
jgi:hypothetical protein